MRIKLQTKSEGDPKEKGERTGVREGSTTTKVRQTRVRVRDEGVKVKGTKVRDVSVQSA